MVVDRIGCQSDFVFGVDRRDYQEEEFAVAVVEADRINWFECSDQRYSDFDSMVVH